MSSEHVEVLWAMLRKCVHERPARKSAETEANALHAAIAALSAPKPEGEWVLVPRVPTPEMLSAAGRLQACECGFIGDMSPMDGEEYAAMLAAAPQPPAEAQPVAPMTGDLLPCPFCGAPAERIDFGPGDAENEGGSCIACTRCQSSGPVEFGRKENFVANWNSRTPPPSAPVGVEGVEAALQKWLDWCNEHSEEPEAKSGARIAIEALAQQPAAVDEAMVERAARAWCAGTDTPFDQLPDTGKARCLEDMRVVLTAALAAQQGGEK